MNGKQQILDAAIRVMSEVGITSKTEEFEMSKHFNDTSAEQWEAMHGIGQEPVQDERPVMMINRAIVKDTAGYVGKVGADSIRMWRLYSTPSGEVWGAEWSHGTEWTQSTWGTMQHLREWVSTTADILDIVAEWERY